MFSARVTVAPLLAVAALFLFVATPASAAEGDTCLVGGTSCGQYFTCYRHSSLSGRAAESSHQQERGLSFGGIISTTPTWGWGRCCLASFDCPRLTCPDGYELNPDTGCRWCKCRELLGGECNASQQCAEGSCVLPTHPHYDPTGTELPELQPASSSSRPGYEYRAGRCCAPLSGCALECVYGFVRDATTGCKTCACQAPREEAEPCWLGDAVEVPQCDEPSLGCARRFRNALEGRDGPAVLAGEATAHQPGAYRPPGPLGTCCAVLSCAEDCPAGHVADPATGCETCQCRPLQGADMLCFRSPQCASGLQCHKERDDAATLADSAPVGRRHRSRRAGAPPRPGALSAQLARLARRDADEEGTCCAALTGGSCPVLRVPVGSTPEEALHTTCDGQGLLWSDGGCALCACNPPVSIPVAAGGRYERRHTGKNGSGRRYRQSAEYLIEASTRETFQACLIRAQELRLAASSDAPVRGVVYTWTSRHCAVIHTLQETITSLYASSYELVGAEVEGSSGELAAEEVPEAEPFDPGFPGYFGKYQLRHTGAHDYVDSLGYDQVYGDGKMYRTYSAGSGGFMALIHAVKGSVTLETCASETLAASRPCFTYYVEWRRCFILKSCETTTTTAATLSYRRRSFYTSFTGGSLFGKH